MQMTRLLTRQHELDHTDHTDHTDQGYICPEKNRSWGWNVSIDDMPNM